MGDDSFITTENFYAQIEKSEELPGVAALIRDGERRILMFLHKRLGKWTIPIGKPKPGESSLVAVKREVREETGLDVLEATFIGCSQFESQRNPDPSMDRFWSSQLYAIECDGDVESAAVNMESGKHLEMRFMNLEEIYKLLTEDQISHATRLMLHYLELQQYGDTFS